MRVKSERAPSIWSGSGSGGRPWSEVLGEPLSMGVGSSSRRDEALEWSNWSSMAATVVVAVVVHESSPQVESAGAWCAWCAGESSISQWIVEPTHSPGPLLSRCLSPAETPERPLTLSRIPPTLGQGRFLAHISAVRSPFQAQTPLHGTPPHWREVHISSSRQFPTAFWSCHLQHHDRRRQLRHHLHLRHDDFRRTSTPKANHLVQSLTK